MNADTQRESHAKTQRHADAEERDRDWSGVATSQGTPVATRSWKRQGRPSLETSEEAWPCHHLDFALGLSLSVLL